MDIINALKNRRSIRKYTAEPIPDEMLDKILQAGLLAPSSRAIFPVEFIVVRDKAMLFQLSRAKNAGSGMLKNADAAIVVIGDKNRSDAWIEDCSLAMIYMQLAALELGIGNCWVQCRGRVSQQKKGQAIITVMENNAEVTIEGSEKLVAATIAKDASLTDNMTADEFLHELLGIPANYEVEAILSLGLPDQTLKERALPDVHSEKIHRDKF